MKGAFSIKSKKTPYQRHKELEEEKKRKADEEAAKVYEEFVESFKGDDAPGKEGGVKAFVRGGVVAPGSRSHDATGACVCVLSSTATAAAGSAAAMRQDTSRQQMVAGAAPAAILPKAPNRSHATGCLEQAAPSMLF